MAKVEVYIIKGMKGVFLKVCLDSGQKNQCGVGPGLKFNSCLENVFMAVEYRDIVCFH